jgi:S1-C subfamily serine protease
MTNRTFLHGLAAGLALLAGVLGLSAVSQSAPPDAGPGLRDLVQVSRVFQELAGEAERSVVAITASSGRRFARGSGVILGADGVIVTNNHVVRDAERVTVTFHDQRTRTATIRGVDPDADLAVLQVDGGPYPAAGLRDAEPAAIGEWVLAIGNPLGLGQSVSFGIVSGTGRSDLRLATYEDFIQTDAVINDGNSGGPLVDLEGRVIGINTARGLPERESLGIGFAIPAGMVREALDDILAFGEVRRGWIGVRFDEVRARGRSVPGATGATLVAISQVIPDGPAALAGMLVDDVVLRVNGEPVSSRPAMLRAVAVQRPGSTAEIEVWRDGELQTLRIEVGTRRPGQD